MDKWTGNAAYEDLGLSRAAWREEKRLCAVRDIAEGEWVVKRPLTTMEELFERYNFEVCLDPPYTKDNGESRDQV